MFLQNLRAKVGARLNGEGEAGFTLIELLVVMLILGILAAIALPAFFNQKEKAGDAKAKEYVHSAQVAMETWSTENGGSYAEGTEETLQESLERIEPTLANAVFVEPPEGAAKTYKINIEGANAEQEFWIERETSGAEVFGCEKTGVGGCPSNGDWSNG